MKKIFVVGAIVSIMGVAFAIDGMEGAIKFGLSLLSAHFIVSATENLKEWAVNECDSKRTDRRA